MAAQDYENVTYNSPAGALIGSSSTEKIGFFGVAPTAQTAAITSVSTSAVITACGVGGFSVAQASAIPVAINAILAALNARGLMA